MSKRYFYYLGISMSNEDDTQAPIKDLPPVMDGRSISANLIPAEERFDLNLDDLALQIQFMFPDLLFAKEDVDQ